ncbi:MAG: hypothetical protein K2P88_13110 [Chitinophagaceae bacterium]|nr:hypothetical protein [Chitinophagaceae bacterium]
MKRILYTFSFLTIALFSKAQLPEDALRVGWSLPSGTARTMAIGGAMAGLGGEITATHINPAGIGLYKTNEFVLSPGINLLGSKGSFRGTDATASNSTAFGLGTSGFVFALGGAKTGNGKWTSKAISLTVNRTANFGGTTYYKGLNTYSSFSEPLANEFANSNLTIDQALNSSNVSMLTKMALYTYLVDTMTVLGQKQVISRAEMAGAVNQEYKATTKGGVTEFALGYGTNMDDKFYLGLGIGIPVMNYERTATYTESDANGRGNNEFAYSTYSETFTSKGVGVNLKLGMMFKPIERLRFGLAVHTPTLYTLDEKITASMTTDIDTATGSVKVFTVNSKDLYNGENPQTKYDLSSPWRFILGGTYILNEVEDVTKHQGFITADVEYVTYGSSRFSASGNESGSTGGNFKAVNDAVKAAYKGALNVKVGGELKFKVIMARLGFAYFGSPYDDKELKANRMNISGGLGYRNKGFFIDLTYVHSLTKDVNFPYRVDPPRLNTFASLRDRASNVMVTLGVKF